MSGDAGLDEPIVFYSREMTQAKLVLLQHKGIHLAYKSFKVNSHARSVEKLET